MTLKSAAKDVQSDLLQEVRKLEVACAELKGLHPSRSVYIRKGALFFRSDIKTAINLQTNMLEKAKANLK